MSISRFTVGSSSPFWVRAGVARARRFGSSPALNTPTRERYDRWSPDAGSTTLCAQHRHRLSELRLVPASRRLRERGVWVTHAQGSRRGLETGWNGPWRWSSYSPLARRKPHQLSGGQQQRVALARAVVIKPDVLLLDEPLGALDKKLRENMQVRLIELHRQLGITTIYVTHDQEEALTMSDRIAVMSSEVHGVVQLDTPQALYHHPRSLFVANFIGTSSTLFDHVAQIDAAMLRTAGGFVAPAAAWCQPFLGHRSC